VVGEVALWGKKGKAASMCCSYSQDIKGPDKLQNLSNCSSPLARQEY
jgi:hypothetical protein